MLIEGVEIKLKMGDLTEEEAEALVNAANNELWMGGGVAGALKRKGGKIIEDEAVSKGPISVGEAIVTTAGNLKAKYVIHGAVMGMDFKTDREKIKNATLNSLKRAGELGLTSIAFPAFGTGVGKFSPQKAAEAMRSAVEEYLKTTQSSLKKITFVLYNKEIYDAFTKVFT